MSKDIDRLISASLDAAAKAAVSDDRQPPVFATDAFEQAGRARRHSVWVAPLLAAAAVVAVVAATGLVAMAHHRSPARPASGSTLARPTPAPSGPTALRPTQTSPSPTPTARRPTQTSPSTTPAIGFELGYQPLWPFGSVQQAEAWLSAYRSGGHQPWHLDAGQTALAFTQGYLGFSGIGVVTGTRSDSLGAHVGVGYRLPNGQLSTAATLHLVRYGTDPMSAWEVVGSDDTTFSLETPVYGSQVTSTVAVGGHITGVDENIRVTVLQLTDAAAVGQACCVAAGGNSQPWRTTVRLAGATSGVLTIVASTGGHIETVERFAIQGVRH